MGWQPRFSRMVAKDLLFSGRSQRFLLANLSFGSFSSSDPNGRRRSLSTPEYRSRETIRRMIRPPGRSLPAYFSAYWPVSSCS
jgi:hypothetical protein